MRNPFSSGVEFRATHRRAVDVDGDHAACVPRREHGAHAGAGAEVEDVGTSAQLEIGNDRGEERAGSQQPGLNTVGSTSSGVPCTSSRRSF